MGFMFKPILNITIFLLISQFHTTKADHDFTNNIDTLNINGSNISNSSRRELGNGKCNWFQGKWVYDASYPLYAPSSCPFIDPEFNCVNHGRPDKYYLKYRWQPYACNLPRFNGLYFLEKFRGKKIMFVGDSLSLNQWNSLTCMIHSWVPNARYSLIRNDGISSVTFQDYGLKILLYRTPFLVDMVRSKSGAILKLDSIYGGNAWLGMDMLIFNTWHWWTHTGRAQPWDYIQDGNKLYKDMNRYIAFYKGLNTWARWVNRNINPLKTKVFFQGISPTHYLGRDWSQPTRSCAGETQPYFGSRYPAGTPMEWFVVQKVLNRIKKPVFLLDITTLSQYRKDGHPTYYGDQKNTDCSHWCLPGVPDTWNLLLYAALFG